MALSGTFADSFNNTALHYNPYKFRARATSFTPSAGAFTKITFDTEDFDTSGNFDNATNYRFTAPVAGFYQFNARASSSNPNTVFLIALYKNGAIYQRGGHNNDAAASGVVYSDMVQAAVNDYFEMFAFSSAAAAFETAAGSQAYFSGYLISLT